MALMVSETLQILLSTTPAAGPPTVAVAKLKPAAPAANGCLANVRTRKPAAHGCLANVRARRPCRAWLPGERQSSQRSLSEVQTLLGRVRADRSRRGCVGTSRA